MSEWTQWLPQINLDACTTCGDCVEVCPTRVLATEDGRLVVAEPESCTYCGWCEGICPEEAITLPYQIVLNDGSFTAENDVT